MTHLESLAKNSRRIIGSLLVLLPAARALAQTNQAVQDRIDVDVGAGKPIVVHVVVALCDNINQGIVPVSKKLGNGQNPDSNLYWGALYGIRTHFPRAAGWTKLRIDAPTDGRILDRSVFCTAVFRNKNPVSVYVIADAWDGAYIRDATQNFLVMAAGRSPKTFEVVHGHLPVTLFAGGASHLVAYVGHNYLMEDALPPGMPANADALPRSAVVLACASKFFFIDHIETAGAHALLLTTGLMAPEAYTLDAAIRSWVSLGTTDAVVEAAAMAYHRYQKCGIGGARRLFWGAP